MPLTTPAVKAKARELGFDLCGVAPAGDLPELAFFHEWLARGYAGAMGYLQRSAARRSDVRRVLPSARTVIVTGTNYNTDRPYSTERSDPASAHVARYAWGDDYHDVILARLEALIDWMRISSDATFEARAYVDTGPVLERVYARHAGIGWIGKNTCVINPVLGSWILLGEIICSLPLEVDEPGLDRCGDCSLCIEACPSSALVAPGVLDATRCVSYLTIESRDVVPDALRDAVGTHVYGCDVCQEVCPWNAAAPRSDEPAWQPRPVWDGADIGTLAAMSDQALEAALEGSAMRRAKVSGLRRNLEIGLRNSEAKRYHRSGKVGAS
jgi:epoxyqueuosine reductase